MQKAARDMAGTEPGAAGRVRDGLSELQQNEAKLRMQYSARWIRQGQGGYMVPREAPITETMDKVAEDLKARAGGGRSERRAGRQRPECGGPVAGAARTDAQPDAADGGSRPTAGRPAGRWRTAGPGQVSSRANGQQGGQQGQGGKQGQVSGEQQAGGGQQGGGQQRKHVRRQPGIRRPSVRDQFGGPARSTAVSRRRGFTRSPTIVRSIRIARFRTPRAR